MDRISAINHATKERSTKKMKQQKKCKKRLPIDIICDITKMKKRNRKNKIINNSYANYLTIAQLYLVLKNSLLLLILKQTKICINLLTFQFLIYIISKENERKKAECESHLP